MTKVCHMTSAHNTTDVRIFQKECVSLAKNGYDVYLVGQGKSRIEKGVNVIGIGDLSHNRINRMIKSTRAIYNKALELDCDIYHFHDPELWPYGLKLKQKRKKVIFDSHEFYREQLKRKHYIPKKITNIIAKIYTMYERQSLKKIDAVIFPCTINGKNPFEGMCKNFEYVNNTPILSELYDRFDAKVCKHKNSVCYIGGLTESRGITNAVKATYIAGASLFLAGRIAPTYKNKLELMPEFINTKYVGVLNRLEVNDFLQHCQVGLATLLNEGQYLMAENLPTKVYEYLSLGLPVIISRTPYNEKIIKKYQFGLVANPTNVIEISEKIRHILNNPEEAKRMGENGRKAIKEEFNWEKEEKKLVSLYERVLDRK